MWSPATTHPPCKRKTCSQNNSGASLGDQARPSLISSHLLRRHLGRQLLKVVLQGISPPSLLVLPDPLPIMRLRSLARGLGSPNSSRLLSMPMSALANLACLGCLSRQTLWLQWPRWLLRVGRRCSQVWIPLYHGYSIRTPPAKWYHWKSRCSSRHSHSRSLLRCSLKHQWASTPHFRQYPRKRLFADAPSTLLRHLQCLQHSRFVARAASVTQCQTQPSCKQPATGTHAAQPRVPRCHLRRRQPTQGCLC